MSANPYFFECVTMAAQSIGTVHAEALQASNPGLATHVHFYPEAEGEAGKILWRNGDRNLREWWKMNRAEVAEDWCLFLDWDVWVNVDLLEVFPEPKSGVGMVAAQVLSGVLAMRSFAPFREVRSLPRAMRSMATGVSPLGVLLVSRACMDSLADPQWDALFAEDIFSELRMPTIARFLGYQVTAAAMPNVGWTPVTPGADETGIWHPVKEAVQ